SHGSRQIFPPRDVAIQRVQRDRRHRQPHRRKIRPRSSPEQTHRRESHGHPQERHFVRRPFRVHFYLPDAKERPPLATASARPIHKPASLAKSVLCNGSFPSNLPPRQLNPSSVTVLFPCFFFLPAASNYLS